MLNKTKTILPLLGLFLSTLSFSAQSESFTYFETPLSDPQKKASDSYVLYTGEFTDSSENRERFQKFIEQTGAAHAKQDAPLFVSSFSFKEALKGGPGSSSKLHQSASRNVAATSKLEELTDKICTLAKNCKKTSHQVIESVKKVLVDQSEKAMKIRFALIAASVDGVANGMVLSLFEKVPLHLAATFGLTVAAFSGSWSYLTPQFSEFLMHRPSLIDQLVKLKSGAVYKGGKWLEALTKWGMIQFAVTAATTTVASQLGIVNFNTYGDLITEVGHTSLLAITGMGLLDLSISIELDQKYLNATDEIAKRKVLRIGYLIGTAAASLNVLGTTASALGLDFGNTLLYGITGGALINMARVNRAQVLSLVSQIRNRCSKVLTAPPKTPFGTRYFENMGAE